MKNTNICPKCQSKDILLIPGKVRELQSGNFIKAGWTIRSIALVDRYLCCNCGYSEEWIKKKDIPMLRKKYD